jgi:ParB family transcriptional regulator, chromosome partitioning protein
LLKPRRYGDGAKDLWTTLNTIQENITKGGQRDYSRRRPDGDRMPKSRAIKGIDEDLRLNKALWHMAKLAKEKRIPKSFGVPCRIIDGEGSTETATEVRGEGWLWVEIQSGESYTDLSKFGRIHSVSAPISDEIRLEIEALQDEQQRIEEKYPEAEEYPPDVHQRMAAIEARIDELNDQPDQPRTYREEEIPLAGAIVALENHGEAVIYRGLVRPEDRKKLAQAAKCETSGQHESGHDNGDETGDEGLSAPLVEDLTAHRTAALRTVLATRPDVALVAVTHALALRMCYECSYDVGSCLSLSSEKGGCRLDSHAKGIETSPAQVQLSEIQSQWLARIPAQAEQLWQWLLDQEQAVVIDLLAFCVGQTVHAVRLHHEGRQPRFVAADQLAQAVKLDMADWWTPTGERYLGRVKKEEILRVIGDGTSETNFEDLRKLKKGELVAAAERRLARSRRLPEILKS